MTAPLDPAPLDPDLDAHAHAHDGLDDHPDADPPSDARPAEQVLRRFSPSPWFIPLRRGGLLALLTLAAFALFSLAAGPAREAMLAAATLASLGATAALVAGALDYATRTYLLTDRRVLAARGVIGRAQVEIPLAGVRSIEVISTPLERVLGLGSVIIGSTSAGGTAVWRCVPDPAAAAAALRRAADDAQQTRPPARRGPEGAVS